MFVDSVYVMLRASNVGYYRHENAEAVTGAQVPNWYYPMHIFPHLFTPYFQF
jgi:hypothetical protein